MIDEAMRLLHRRRIEDMTIRQIAAIRVVAVEDQTADALAQVRAQAKAAEVGAGTWLAPPFLNGIEWSTFPARVGSHQS
jgi:hypothetical protein